MTGKPSIFFTVTNDLTYDQRMYRICSSLATAGYAVTLVGRELPDSRPLEKLPWQQVRIPCKYQSGKLFYLEFNHKLFQYLNKALARRHSQVALCAIDLDTILPVLRASQKWKTPRVYDAHELFTELTEVKRRPAIHAIWNWVEKTAVPRFAAGYTVNQFIADEFHRRYGVHYGVVRNLPFAAKSTSEGDLPFALPPAPFFLYQGAVNEGRAFDSLIPAMKLVNAPLVIAGDGNYFEQTRQLVHRHGLEHKIFMLGYVQPADLKRLTPRSYAGLTLFDNTGLNQYYSLANRYFDYIQGGIPQLCVNYPEYAALNNQYPTSLLLDDLSPANIAAQLNKLLDDDVLHSTLKAACTAAAANLNWENESRKLVAFWQQILPIN